MWQKQRMEDKRKERRRSIFAADMFLGIR